MTTRPTRSPPRRRSSPACRGSTGCARSASGTPPTSATWCCSRRRGGSGWCSSLAVGSQERHLGGGVLESQFVQEWVGLLHDPELAAACERAGVRLAFLPHPNLEKLLPELDVPAARADAVLRRRRRAGAVRASAGARDGLLLDRLQRRLPRAAGRLLPVRRGPGAGRRPRRPARLLRVRARRVRPGGARARAAVSAIAEALAHGGAPLPDVRRAHRGHLPAARRWLLRARGPGGAGLDEARPGHRRRADPGVRGRPGGQP